MDITSEDLAEWFDERGLSRRRDAMRKNLSVALADAVGVAEIIHAYYPKLVQVSTNHLVLCVLKERVLL
jgi:hypothetical protein